MALQRSSINFRQSLSQCVGGNGSDDSTAFVAHNIGVIAANNAFRLVAIRLAEIGVRKRRLYDVVLVHTLTVMQDVSLP